jgi:hypothetical protein
MRHWEKRESAAAHASVVTHAATTPQCPFCALLALCCYHLPLEDLGSEISIACISTALPQ